MVHNGIEYGDMQLIAEAYHLLRSGLGLSNEELANVFAEWNKGMLIVYANRTLTNCSLYSIIGDLDSYLIEITEQIFRKKDEEKPDQYVLDLIVDSAGQKGTGKWTASAALDFGIPVTLIGEVD